MGTKQPTEIGKCSIYSLKESELNYSYDGSATHAQKLTMSSEFKMLALRFPQLLKP